MYRTYRNLYRIRPSLTSIGIGENRIKLPRNMEITLDLVILFVVLFLVSMLIVIPIINLFYPMDYPIFVGLIFSGVAARWASKQDAYGKPITEYLYGLFKFLLRSKIHDGWQRLPRNRVGKVKVIRNHIRIAYLDNGRVGSLPASGKSTDFELRVSTAVKVKGGKVWFGRGSALWNRKILKPGVYRIVDGEIQEGRSKKMKPPLIIPRKK